jgi:ParB family chromosome partitioning protein
VLNNFSTPSAMRGIVEEIEINKLNVPDFAMHENSSADVDELALSIIRCGILNPIVIKVKDDKFEIISGTRRYLACKKLRWKKFPVIL